MLFSKKVFSLSKAQKRIWYKVKLHESERGIGIVYSLKGHLVFERLEKALYELVEEHKIFKSVIYQDGHRLERVVKKEIKGELQYIDALNSEQIKNISITIEQLLQKELNLTQGPLFRFYLVRENQELHHLVLMVHPIIISRGALRAFSKQISYYYNKQFVSYANKDFIHTVTKFEEVIAQEEQYLKTDHYYEGLLHWVNTLKANEFSFTLPAKKSFKETYYENNRIDFSLNRDENKIFYAYLLNENVNAYAVLMAVYQVLLYRYSQNDDVIVSYSFQNTYSESQTAIGCVDNKAHCRTCFTGEERFVDLVNDLSFRLNCDSYYKSVPLTDIVRMVRDRFSKKFSGNFTNVALEKLSYPYEEMKLFGLVAEPKTEYTRKIPQEDLIIYFDDAAGRLQLELEYTKDFSAEAAFAFSLHFKNLLNYFIANPMQQISQAFFLSQEELNVIHNQWNHSESVNLEKKSLGVLFFEQVKLHASHNAVEFGGKILTYAELGQEVQKYATELQARFVQHTGNFLNPDTPIAIYLERSLEAIIAMLAVTACGAAYVPISTDYPEDRVQYILEDTECEFVLTTRSLLEKTHALNFVPQKICVDESFLFYNEQFTPAHVSAQSLTHIIYTSGTTGKPKGVMIPHAGVIRLVKGNNFFTRPKSVRTAQVSNLSFDAATFEVWGTFLNAGTLVIVPKEDLLEINVFSQFLLQKKIDLLLLTTALFHQFATKNPKMFHSLHCLFVGGDAVNSQLVNSVLTMSKGRLTAVVNAYGPAENSVLTTTYSVVPSAFVENPLPIGKPLRFTNCFVLDKNGQLCPWGVPGELYTGGLGLARGYWKKESLTEQKFVEIELPVSFDGTKTTHNRLFKTGDIVSWSLEGNLEFIGRADNQVKIRGFRIELSEIENILQNFSEVKQSIVLTLPDPNGDKSLVAYVVGRQKKSFIDERKLKSHLRKFLPEYMIPNRYMQLSDFPMTPNGKVNRGALPNPFETTSIMCGSKNTRENIAHLWSELFRMPREEINDESDFFELGGHSLLVTQFVAKLRSLYGFVLHVVDVFRLRKLNAIAECIDKSKEQVTFDFKYCLADKINVYPLSFSEKRAWFSYQISPDSPYYNLPFLIQFKGMLSVPAFKTALKLILKKNDIFNLRFFEENGQVFQIFQRHEVEISQRDFINYESLLNYAQEKKKKVFSLTKDILYEIEILQENNEKQVYLFFHIHHIIFDGWSLNVLMDKLSDVYELVLHNQIPVLESKFDYFDYSVTQNQWYKNNLFQKQLSYWQNKLAGELPILDLPYDKPRPLIRTTQGENFPITITIEQTQSLRQLSTTYNTTIYNVVLAAYSVFLHKICQQDEIMIGTPIANRNHEPFVNVLGFFVNTIPYRVQIKRQGRFIDLLEIIDKSSNEAAENQDIPYDLIVENLNIDRQSGIHPVFQTMFTLQTGITLSGSWRSLGIDYVIEQLPRQTAKQDLCLVLYEMADGSLQGDFEYSTDVFERESVERLAFYFNHLLAQMIHDPLKKIVYYTLMDQNDLYAKNYGQNFLITPKKHDIIPYYFEQQVLQNGDLVAVVSGDMFLTYNELNKAANRLAHYLKDYYTDYCHKKLQTSTFIGVAVSRSVQMVVTLLACLKAGAVYVPLDPSYPLERLQYIVSDTGLSLIITDNLSLPRISSLSEKAVLFSVDDNTIEINKCSVHNLEPVAKPHDLAYVIYTSGTTGKPKGVLVEHKGVPYLAMEKIKIYGFKQSMSLLQFASINFDAAVAEIYTCLFSSGVLHIANEEVRHDPVLLADYLEEHKINVVTLPPAVLEILPKKSLPNLKTLIVAGDICSAEIIAYWQKDRKFLNAYGPSEATVCSTIGELTSHSNPHDIGKQLSHVEALVLDRDLNFIPIGGMGELFIGGVSLARGYLNRVDLTAKAFVAHPFSENPRDRLYRTGDWVRVLANGHFEFVGRKDHQVKINGYRIELAEIEHVLNSYPGILQCAVIARESQGLKQIIAFYSQISSLEEQSLREYLETYLPQYMVPHFFVLMQELPLNINDKIDRKKLAELNIDENLQHRNMVAPRNEIEKKLVRIWCDLLKISKLGVYENFFHVGGNSLLSVSLLSRVNQVFHKKIEYSKFSAVPVIANLAKLIANDSLNSDAQAELAEKMDYDSLLPIVISTQKIAEECFVNCVLLTGANGFVGVHLLSELLAQTNAHIYCLIRGVHALDKLHVSLKKYDLDFSQISARITVLSADLSQEYFGLNEEIYKKLCEEVEVVYHNAAWVNHVLDYSTLREINVIGTQRLLNFSGTGQLKKFNYVSTLSAASYIKDGFILEEGPSEVPPVSVGYVLTKWVSERLVWRARQQGMPANIFRLGNVTGHSLNGRSNYHENHQWLLVKGCLQMGYAPNWERSMEMSPVDFIANSIIKIGLQNKNQVIHLSNPTSMSWKEYITAINNQGFSIHLVSSEEWLDYLLHHTDENNALFPLRQLYEDLLGQNKNEQTNELMIGQEKTLSLLNGVYPSAYKKWIALYVDHLKREGFLTGDTMQVSQEISMNVAIVQTS